MRRILLTLVIVLLAPHPVQAQALVLTAEREIAALPYEVQIGYDVRGRERWRFTSDADGRIEMPEWMPRSIHNGTFTHNHPGQGACVNLSVDDVQFAAWYGLREIRAVGYEAGHIYVAIIDAPHWITAAQWNSVFDRERYRGWCAAISAAWADLGIAFVRIAD